MSTMARNSLAAYHGVPTELVSVIPHGVPEVPKEIMSRREAIRESLGWTGRKVLMQNGLLHLQKV